MTAKLTLDYVIHFYQNINFEFLDSFYVNRHYSHNIRCIKCNFQWKGTLGNLKKQINGCPQCTNENKKTKICDIHFHCVSKNIVFLDTAYLGAHFKHNFQCLKCDHNWKTKTNNIINLNQSCPKCAIVNNRLDINVLKEELLLKNIQFLNTSYTRIDRQYNFQCIICSCIWETSINHVKNQGTGCPKCSIKKGMLNQQITCLKKYGVKYASQNKEIAIKTAKSSNNSQILHHWLTNEELVCIASYEINTVKYLNENQINFKWQPEVFQLSKNTYLPDLYLIDEDKWIEIKGYFRKDALDKWNEFQLIKPNSELWNQKTLKQMGIIK